jgi:hypothetical protein
MLIMIVVSAVLSQIRSIKIKEPQRHLPRGLQGASGKGSIHYSASANSGRSPVMRGAESESLQGIGMNQ